MNFDLISSR